MIKRPAAMCSAIHTLHGTQKKNTTEKHTCGQTHLHGVGGGLGHVVHRRDLVKGGLVDVTDHADGGLARHGGHGGAVAAADAADADDPNLFF